MTAAIRGSAFRNALRRGCAWSRVAGEVTRSIRVGVYRPGARLPAASERAERLSVNRHTVRRAIAELAVRGVVRVVQGSGTYVQDFALELMFGRRTRQSMSLRQVGLRGTLRVLDAVRMHAPAQVARALQIASHQPVLRVQTLGEARRRVLHVSERFFPLPRFHHAGACRMRGARLPPARQPRQCGAAGRADRGAVASGGVPSGAAGREPQ